MEIFRLVVLAQDDVWGGGVLAKMNIHNRHFDWNGEISVFIGVALIYCSVG
jgi:hypothetical protein